MKIEENQISGILKAMTVSVFASLPSAWPEYLEPCGGQGVLIARISQNCNDQFNDTDVVARAIVFMPGDEIEDSHLRRLTIRNQDLDIDPKYVEGALSNFRYLDYWDNEREPATSRVSRYHQCAQAILELSAIDLWNPLR